MYIQVRFSKRGTFFKKFLVSGFPTFSKFPKIASTRGDSDICTSLLTSAEPFLWAIGVLFSYFLMDLIRKIAVFSGFWSRGVFKTREKGDHWSETGGTRGGPQGHPLRIRPWSDSHGVFFMVGFSGGPSRRLLETCGGSACCICERCEFVFSEVRVVHYFSLLF